MDVERWKQLCEQAVVEQDPDKLMRLVAEINRLLSEKEERLKANRARNEVPEKGEPTGG
jgi:hypothetical protein